MPLCKKMDYDAKTEAPCLATTLIIIPTKKHIKKCLGNSTYD
jgi:hypothetical protein